MVYNGYMSVDSNTSLAEKLGLAPGMHVVLVNAPDDFESLLNPLPREISFDDALKPNAPYIHFFTTSKKDLGDSFPDLKTHLSPTGMLWISWPKGSSGQQTDLNENDVRQIGLKNGLVDVKICSIDDTWSGLKFVFRLRDR